MAFETQYEIPALALDFGNQPGTAGSGLFDNNKSFAEKLSFGANGATNPAPYTVDPSFGLFDQKDSNGVLTQQGVLAPALGAAGSLFNIFAGFKGLSQQDEIIDFQKDSFNKNFAANKAAFQENLRSKYGRKATLGGNKGVTEKEFVDKRSDF